MSRIPAKATVQVDNDRVVVTEWRFAPGAETTWHRHGYDYVVVPLGTGKLLLSSAASQLVLMPTGVVTLSGLYAEGLYFKKMLDNIGVTADIIHCGAYKSAGEPFYLEGPSKEAEEQTNSLIDSIFAQLVDQLAKSRGVAYKVIDNLLLLTDVAVSGLSGNNLVQSFNDMAASFGSAATSLAIDRLSKAALEGTVLD